MSRPSRPRPPPNPTPINIISPWSETEKLIPRDFGRFATPEYETCGQAVRRFICGLCCMFEETVYSSTRALNRDLRRGTRQVHYCWRTCKCCGGDAASVK
jgi:hypothetical protein